MANWYVGSTNWSAITAWAALTVYSVGDIRRQLAAPAVGSERAFRCTTAGTSLAAEPTWNLTVGSTTTEAAGPVWTEITGNNTYGWTAAHARLANAFASGWGAAGDTFYLGDNSAETQATAMTLTSPGTAVSPCAVLCVDDSATPPTTLATTATINATVTSAITLAGFAYVYGVTLQTGSGSSSASTQILINPTTPFWFRFEACELSLASTGNASMVFGNASSSVDDNLIEMVNTKVRFAAVGQSIITRCRFKWWGTTSAVAGATLPTSLFVPPIGNSTTHEITGVDLSALGSGKSWVNVAAASQASFLFADCMAGTSVAFTTNAVAGQGGIEVKVVNCDNADTNYRYYWQSYQGTIAQETTIIRTGGASDGTTPVSRKVVTTANTKFYSPMVSDWIPYWNETLSAITVTVPVLTDNITLTNADAWLEVEYLGTTNLPLGVFANDRAADILAAPANQTTDGVSSWASAPGTPVKQSLSVTVTPAEKGLLRARVCVARASTTLYFDPLLAIT